MIKNSAVTDRAQRTGEDVIAVKRLAEFDEIEPLRPEWEALHAALIPGSIHADLDWFLTIVRLGPQPRTPLVFTFRRNGKLIGIVAGFTHFREIDLKVGYLRLGRFTVPAFSTNYHCCIALPEGTGDTLYQKMADTLRYELLHGPSRVVYVNALPTDEPLYRTLAKSSMTKGPTLAYPQARHMMIQLAPTIEETISRRGPSVRSAIRRSLNKNKNSATPFTMRLFTLPEEIDAYFNDAEKVAIKTYQRALGVGFNPTPLHHTQATLAARKGWFRGHVLYSGSTPVAFQEDYLCDSHVFNPYVGYDPAFRDMNPGTVLLVKSWEALGKTSRAAIYDFGFGEGVYKERLADVCICEGELLLFAPTVKNLLFFVILSVNNVIDTTIKRALSSLGIYDAIKKFWRRKKAGI